MKKFNSLLSVLIGTLVFTSTVNAQAIEAEKAKPINHQDLHTAISLELQNIVTLPKAMVAVETKLTNSLFVKNTQQNSNEATVAKISYRAE